MLNNINKLFFPKIVFKKSSEIIQSQNDSKIVNLYNIEWTKKETKVNNGEQELSYEYETLLRKYCYAIPDSYLREIRRASWMAVYEFNINRQMDTSLKDTYLIPTMSYIKEAFKLISKCLFDEDTNYYYVGEDKIIFEYLLLHKFWKNQISNPLLLEFSGVDEMMVLSMSTSISETEKTHLNNLLNYINDYD